MLLARLDADKGEERPSVEKVKWTKIFFDYKIWML